MSNSIRELLTLELWVLGLCNRRYGLRAQQ